MLLLRQYGGFSPLNLFANSVKGAWFDPSDVSTLFTDSAGTTPVTAVEQPVGLMLDKSQGLALGPDLIGSTTPSPYSANGTVSLASGVATATCTVNGNYGMVFPSGYAANSTYKMAFVVVTNSAAKTINFWASTNGTSGSAGTTTGSKIGILQTTTGNTAIAIIGGLAGESFSVQFFTMQLLPGNHATQATAGNRPTYRARYNLLTFSEQFDNAAWSTVSGTLTPNTTVAPDGNTTADTFTASANTGRVQTNYNAVGAWVSVYVKPLVGSLFAINTNGALAADATVFNVSTGIVVSTGASNANSAITSVGNGWYRCSTQRTVAAGAGTAVLLGSLSSGGGSTDSFAIWGAQVNNGTSLSAYQSITTATSYNAVGFLPYLAFNGTSSAMATAAIDFSATDAMSVYAGVSMLASASTSILSELSANANSNNGSFFLAAPNAANTYGFASKGTTIAAPQTAASFTAPVTSVVTGLGKISTPIASIRTNGGNQVDVATTQGTGNFGNYPLYVGARAGTSIWFNGNLYSLIVRGASSTAAEIASTEAFVNSKCAAY